jgi:hydroxyacylglutathione hydrolase
MRVDENLALVGDRQFGLSGPFDCHVWAIRSSQGAVLVDAGAGTHGELILRNLQNDFGDPRVTAVLLTHAHPDHSGGAAWLRRECGCEVIAPLPSVAAVESADEQASGLAAAKQSGVYPASLTLEPCPVAKSVEHGEELGLSGIRFHAIHVRGHSPDAFCYLAEVRGRRSLFAGDVVFYGGVLGVVNAPGSGMEGYRSDLGRLEGLQVEALLPGHGMFTLREGQQHINVALQETRKNPMPRQIAQGEAIF